MTESADDEQVWGGPAEQRRRLQKQHERIMASLDRREPDGVVAVEPGGRHARLVRKNGRLVCECPYACIAAYEPCAFEEMR